MSGYNDKVKMYTASEEIKQIDKSTINAGLEGNTLKLTDIISDFDSNSYGNKVVVEEGTMYYLAPKPKKRTTQIKREILLVEIIFNLMNK